MQAHKKVSVAQAAKLLGISKEAVYNRIRRGSLHSVQKGGIKMVLLDENYLNSNGESLSASDALNTLAQHDESEPYLKDEFIDYLKAQIAELKAQNAGLEADKERLYKEREEIITKNKNEIKELYKERDDRLLQFLSALHAKPLLSETIDIEAEPINPDDNQKWASLDEFISGLNLDEKASKKISKKIIKRAGFSKHIKYRDGVILIRKNKDINKILGEI